MKIVALLAATVALSSGSGLAKPLENEQEALASFSRALSPGSTRPSNLTHQPLPQVPGVTVVPPVIPASELTSPGLPPPRRRHEPMK